VVGEATVGLAAGWEGVEKSNKSSRPELVFEMGGDDIPGAESNAPKPLDELNPRLGWAGAGAGFVSKKLPPPRLPGGEET
tara:strand:+ start:1402 stop:1641 length:240 start_codon:yes stop_codon:yes gene_type:complete